jgi:hypothetical protein
MCRNIKTLFNFVPPVTTEEIRAAALQFVRKISGFNKPEGERSLCFRRLWTRSQRPRLGLYIRLERRHHPKIANKSRQRRGPVRPTDSVLECSRIGPEQKRGAASVRPAHRLPLAW